MSGETDIFNAQSASPMLIGLETQPFDDPDWVFELKLDGERCLAYLDRETLLINKRERRLAAILPELSELHKQARQRCILDGEIIVVDEHGKPDFEQIKNRALTSDPLRISRHARRSPATFVAFDILYLNKSQLTASPLTERRQALDKNVTQSERLSLSQWFDQGKKLYALTVEHGLEGVIAKKRASLYYMGKRTRDWAKVKNQQDDDYVIGGYILRPGQSVASLVLGQYDDKRELLYTGRVTIGLQREDFRIIQSQPLRAETPFSGALPKEARTAVWIEPNLVCSVNFILKLPDGGLRQPIYKGLRLDKDPFSTLAD